MVRNHCLYFTLKMNLLDVYKSKSNSHVNLHNHTIKAKRKCSKKKKERKKKKKKRKERWEVPNSHFKTKTPSLTVLH